MNNLKPDAEEFRRHLATLKGETWLGKQREWWPEFLFHYTDIQNAVSILRMGEILSRSQIRTVGEFTDSASLDVITQTEDRWKDYVRFYFRPMTPTLYHNEGFRPKQRQSMNSHCPMPIYLLFDFEEIICQEGTQFSRGSLARKRSDVFSSSKEFITLPFESIYHNSWFEPHEKDTIIYHRQAEVIVPKRLGLKNLKYIWCRSQAEKETLLYYLPEQTMIRWRHKIGSSATNNLFHRKWIYVDQATLTENEIKLQFNLPISELDKGPFVARIVIEEKWTNQTYVWEDSDFHFHDQHDQVVKFSLSNLRDPTDYEVQFTLDDHRAFTGRYQQDYIPF